MLLRSIRQLVAFVGILVFVTTSILLLKFYDASTVSLPYITDRWSESDFLGGRTSSDSSSAQDAFPSADEHEYNSDEFDLNVYGKPVHEIFSTSGKNGKYFSLEFGQYEAYNPSILPHPTEEDTYIVIAQQERTETYNTVWFAQFVCKAKFQRGKLACIDTPLYLPIAATSNENGKCTGELNMFAFNVGPHDARVFYGPSNPYAVYGSQSPYNSCFGQYIQDLRLLTDWGMVADKAPFRKQTELQRPGPYGAVEKNWFIFWDSAGQMYVHYDLTPKRSFAQLSADGSVGIDLAPLSAKDDEKCLATYMPQIAPAKESIHQSTNSLKVTMCKRYDSTCKPTDSNTFIMTVFHHKAYYQYHGTYEPYVMLFKSSAPFAVHAISTKPIWIHGRKQAPRPEYLTGSEVWNATEMFYVTSISWKGHGLTYHGYLDDELFLGFGIEDRRAAGIDVTAGDILDHLGLCSDVDAVVNPPIPNMGGNTGIPSVSDVLPDLSGLDLSQPQGGGDLDSSTGLGAGLGLDGADLFPAPLPGDSLI